MATSRFHVCNFQGSIHVMMNKEFAAEIYEFIRARSEEVEISQQMFALTEQIEKQFFFMDDLTQRHTRRTLPTVGEVTAAVAAVAAASE